MSTVLQDKVRLATLETEPLVVSVPCAGPEGIGGAAKRLVDILGASVALLVTLPALLLISLLIVLESGWPVFFCQQRLGRGGRPFKVYKFRSMIRDAESRMMEVAAFNEVKDGPIFKLRNDPRITRVGRFLRKTSLDELPQLINVIKGEMSLVGPRPPLASEVLKYEDWQLRRLAVKPGMTGLWQVNGRSTVGFVDMVLLDLEYIDEWSLAKDIYLLAKTPLAVISTRGAY